MDKQSEQNNLLLAIDGNSLLYQAYYAFFKVNLTTRDGFPTGALKGFFTKLMELLKYNPSHLITLWRGGSTPRKGRRTISVCAQPHG